MFLLHHNSHERKKARDWSSQGHALQPDQSCRGGKVNSEFRTSPKNRENRQVEEKVGFPFTLVVIKKSNLHYVRGVTPKPVTNGGSYLSFLAPG